MQTPHQEKCLIDSQSIITKLIEIMDIYNKASALASLKNNRNDVSFVNEANGNLMERINRALTPFVYRSLRQNYELEGQFYTLICNAMEGKGNEALKHQLAILKKQDEDSNTITASFMELKSVSPAFVFAGIPCALAVGFAALIVSVTLLIITFNPILIVLAVFGVLALLLPCTPIFLSYFTSKRTLSENWERITSGVDVLSESETIELLKILNQEKERLNQAYEAARSKATHLTQPKNRPSPSPLLSFNAANSYDTEKLKAEEAQRKFTEILTNQGLDFKKAMAHIRVHGYTDGVIQKGYNDQGFYLTYESYGDMFEVGDADSQAEFQKGCQLVQTLLEGNVSSRIPLYENCIVIEVDTILNMNLKKYSQC